MARVCVEQFPKGSRPHQREPGFHMDDILKAQIDVLIKNITKDWDFTIIISGSGEVRVGKSLMAMQIATYWKDQMQKVHGINVPFSVKENFVMDGRKLIEIGNKLGQNNPYSPLIFDEAGADLEGKKVMTQLTQDVLDFYRECGQYNLLNILVLPEYFDLPKGIAMTRSICLIDVYYIIDQNTIFQRGYFNFYSKRAKKKLYLKGKRELDYKAAKYDLHGRFFNFYTLDEKAYRLLKQEALTKRENKRTNKFQKQRDACWFLLHKEFGLTQAELCKRMEQLTGIYIPHSALSDGISHFVFENE